MRIFRHYAELPDAFRGGVVALGNFDGIHLGHQRVIGHALAAARKKPAVCGVMSFDPHPRSVFQPDLPPFCLTPFRIKIRLIEALGVDFLLLQHFDLQFAAHTARHFVEEVLVKGLGVCEVVVGWDYHFGHRREGDVEKLRQMAAQRFEVTCITPVAAENGMVYSSSRIREALQNGRPREAAQLLGRDWEIEGRVERGDHRGRTMGFPTANVGLDGYLRPASGVYAVRAGVDHGGATVWLPGVANLGHRPTFNKEEPLLEVHLFDFDSDLYGRHLRVALIDYLRPEKKFSGLDTLKAQIENDCEAARRSLAARRAS